MLLARNQCRWRLCRLVRDVERSFSRGRGGWFSSVLQPGRGCKKLARFPHLPFWIFGRLFLQGVAENVAPARRNGRIGEEEVEELKFDERNFR